MKKLGKKSKTPYNTVEMFSACYANCHCSCGSAPTQSIALSDFQHAGLTTTVHMYG